FEELNTFWILLGSEDINISRNETWFQSMREHIIIHCHRATNNYVILILPHHRNEIWMNRNEKLFNCWRKRSEFLLLLAVSFSHVIQEQITLLTKMLVKFTVGYIIVLIMR